jgi:hypothetical protein
MNGAHQLLARESKEVSRRKMSVWFEPMVSTHDSRVSFDFSST